ncbi:MAG: hypothetical protein OXU77_00290 [Gammaproteobacteria bacterium]|nr:hypothetical protein [Gammaproteobacteria bacterium]MDE0444735.1 hypothetical protein [Gammaproteobacteria bacterium]
MSPTETRHGLLVPSLAQHLLVTDLVKGEGLDPGLIVPSATATIATGLACALATVRRYGSERVLI